ncbi:type II toxin-antitoxin system RelB/DinJ family antitoxin [Levilactobacillus fujinensis]|uniref:Type II toxin-antitoxin system RelB/DinJ family antitoxin n=1 Tax=Levilactobacillus fujinensis TaxID=2486024 RepID=A0ABW1TI69_9LACO|nr:type II toxin-antitoxin system RelB/DinJ family antitoxin [Levilactobacillus fujinensis]
MTSQIHFRMNEKDKENLEIVMNKVGLTPAEVFRIFAKKSIEVSQPSPQLKAALKSHDFVEFDDSDKGLEWLND